MHRHNKNCLYSGLHILAYIVYRTVWNAIVINVGLTIGTGIGIKKLKFIQENYGTLWNCTFFQIYCLGFYLFLLHY